MGCGWGKQNVIDKRESTRTQAGNDNTTQKASQPPPTQYNVVVSDENASPESDRPGNVANSMPAVLDVKASPGTSAVTKSINNPSRAKEPEKFSLSWDLYKISPELKQSQYSTLGDWQNVLRRKANMKDQTPYNHVATTPDIDNLAIHNNWDRNLLLDLPSMILSLSPRDWVKESINLSCEKLKIEASRSAHLTMAIDRKLLQLTQHFRWFLWSLAAYCHVSLSGQDGDERILTSFDKLSRNSGESPSLNDSSEEIPRELSKWFSGFVYKNVYFRLAYAQSEIGHLIKSEISALKKIILSFEHQNSKSSYKITPAITSAVRFGALILYGTPVYDSHFLEIIPNGLSVPMFGRRDFQITADLIYKIWLPYEGQVDTMHCLIVNAHKLIPVVRTPEFQITIPVKSEAIQITDAPKPRDEVRMTAQVTLGEDNVIERQVTRFGWEAMIYSSRQGDKNMRASILGQECKGISFVKLSLGHRVQRRFPTIHTTDAEYTKWKCKAITEIQKILEINDNITTHQSLSELLKRKGLNTYTEWIVLSRIRAERAKIIVQTDILARALRDVVNDECAANAYQTQKYKSLIVDYLGQILSPHYNTQFQNQTIMFALFLNRLLALRDQYLMKKIKQKKKQVLAPNLKHHMTPYDLLQTDDVIKEVYESASTNPALFLSAVGYHLRIEFSPDYLTSARADYFAFLCKEPVISTDSIARVQMNLLNFMSLREEAFINLLHFLDPYGSYQAISQSYESESARALIFDQSSSSFLSGISVTDIEIQLAEEEEKISQQNELIAPSDLYAIPRCGIFREMYEEPSLAVVTEWVSTLDPLVRDLVSPDGEETVLIEALLLNTQLIYFHERDSWKCLVNLRKVEDMINSAALCPAELVIACHMWNGIIQESTNLVESEASYVTALILLNRLFGDPRGRMNKGVPWQMLAGWKISQIARGEGRNHDAILADEFYDAAYLNTKQFTRDKLRRLNERFARRNANEDMVSRVPFSHWSQPCNSSRNLQASLLEDLVPGSFSSFYSWFSRHNIIMFQSGVKWTNAMIKYYVSLAQDTRGQATSQFISPNPSIGSNMQSQRGDRYNSMQNPTLSTVLSPDNGELAKESQRGYVYVWGTDNKGQLGMDITRENFDLNHQPSIESDILSNAQSAIRDEGLKIPIPRLQTYLKDLIIRDVACGFDHCLAVTIEGRWYGWGNNEYSQLGLGNPCYGQVVSIPMHLTTVDRIKKVSCGYQHSVLVSHDFQVFTMGNGEVGLLGTGQLEIAHTPYKIRQIEEEKVVQVECGAFHSVAMTREGNLFVWGRGDGGQLGLKPRVIHKKLRSSKIEVPLEEYICLTPEPIQFPTKPLPNSNEPVQPTPPRVIIMQIACGEAHTLALTTDNKVFGWGANSNGQLGTGVCSENYSPGTGERSTTECEPIEIESLDNYVVMGISAGGAFSSFITKSGEVLMCGNDNKGQLGIDREEGVHNDVPHPTALQSMHGTPINKIFCGLHHAFAVSGKETKMNLFAWGEHRYGQLGAGDRSKSTTRVVQGLTNTNIQKVACGGFFSVALVGSTMNMLKSKGSHPHKPEAWEVKYNETV